MGTLGIINRIKDKVQESKNYSEESIEVKNNQGYDTIWLFKFAILKIKEMKRETRIEIAKKYLELFKLDNEVRFTKSEPEWGKITIDEQVAEKILDNIKDVFEQCYLDEPVESFGCCSRYLECSDKKKCIHPDLKFAKGCNYKVNLEKGKIFYGKNISTG